VIIVAFPPSLQVTADSQPSISFDRPWYKVNDRGILTVIDPSVNVPNQNDTVSVRFFSSVDKGGLLLTLRETSPNSGIFQEIVTWTTDLESSSTRLHVEEGGTISAIYKDLIATARIIRVNWTLSFAGPYLAEDTRIGSNVKIGNDLTIRGQIINLRNEPINFVYIVQIVNSEGFTSQLSTGKGLLGNRLSTSLAVPWKVSELGDYEFKVFLWSDSENPEALTEMTGGQVTLIDYDIPIDAKTAVRFATKADEWTQQALKAVSIQTSYYYLQWDGRLYSSDQTTHNIGSFLGTTNNTTDVNNHYVWKVRMWPKLASLPVSWSYYVDEQNGSVVVKECIKITCDELKQLIEKYNEFPAQHYYHAESRISQAVDINEIVTKLENSTIKVTLQSNPYCSESYPYSYDGKVTTSAILYNKIPLYRLNFQYSNSTGLTSIIITSPEGPDKFLDGWMGASILRYAGLNLGKPHFKQEDSWETFSYSYRGQPNWSLIKKDLRPMIDMQLSGSCVREVYPLGSIDYAVPYVALEQDVLKNDVKVATIKLFVNELGFLEVSIESKEKLNPMQILSDLFEAALLPASALDDMKFEYSGPAD
jgi:hypothetical protein